jgi:hypothetical protein
MTQNVQKIAAVEATTRYTPGHLLAPFGWAADAVGVMVEAEPTLLFHLFELDRARMHLIALALAHLNEFSPDIGVFLASGSVRAVSERILGRCPTGIKRALVNLPPRVMPPEDYRRLVELLANRDTAKLLHHARSIDSSKIEALHGLPAPLCSPLMVHALERHDGASGFSDGLRLLVSRGAASSFNALVHELSSVSQPGRLFAKLRDIVEALPLLPNTFPPIQVGGARRLDQPVTIRALAKSWRNCLVSYLNDIDAGTCAVYLWQDSHPPAACSVRKYGRLGWFLEQVKGPQNVDVEPGQLATIRSAFGEVGIPDYSVIAAISGMIREVDMDKTYLTPLEQQQALNELFLINPEAALDLTEV